MTVLSTCVDLFSHRILPFPSSPTPHPLPPVLTNNWDIHTNFRDCGHTQALATESEVVLALFRQPLPLPEDREAEDENTSEGGDEKTSEGGGGAGDRKDLEGEGTVEMVGCTTEEVDGALRSGVLFSPSNEGQLVSEVMDGLYYPLLSSLRSVLNVHAPSAALYRMKEKKQKRKETPDEGKEEGDRTWTEDEGGLWAWFVGGDSSSASAEDNANSAKRDEEQSANVIEVEDDNAAGTVIALSGLNLVRSFRLLHLLSFYRQMMKVCRYGKGRISCLTFLVFLFLHL